METKNITFTVSPPFAGFEYPAAPCQCSSEAATGAHAHPAANAAHAAAPDIRGSLPGTDFIRLDSATEWIITTTAGAVVSRNANDGKNVARLNRIFGRYVIARHTHGSAELTIECIEGRILGRYAAAAAAAPDAAAPSLREIDGRLVITWPNEIIIVGFNFAVIATIPCAHIIDTADPRIWIVARRAAAGADETKNTTCYYDIARLRPIHILGAGASFRAWAAPRIAAESTPAGTQLRRFAAE